METAIDKLWGIVLASGEGVRLREFVKNYYGYYKPKQFCSFLGTRSMLQHTVSRVSKLIPFNKLLVVTNAEHKEYCSDQLESTLVNNMIEQPCLRDTGVGILLPVIKVHNQAPDSTIAIFPSDHFIIEEDRFMEYVMIATKFVEKFPEKICLLGVQPEKLESGYGWIDVDRRLDNISGKNVYSVSKFVEKPDLFLHKTMIGNKNLINTFVMIGKSRTFLKYFNSFTPQLMKSFDPIRRMIGTPYEMSMIRRFYKYLPAFNFSKSILERICENLAVIELKDVYWNDWGEEERILNDLERFRKIYSYTLCSA